MMKLHSVTLSSEEQKHLTALVRSGTHPARVFQRAHILLKAHQGFTDATIARHLDSGVRTIAEVRKRSCTAGLKRGLWDAPRSGRPPVYTPKQHAKIVATACTLPPAGNAHWTLNLLVEEASKNSIPMKRSKIATLLKQHQLQPWRKKNGVCPELDTRVQGALGGSRESV